jgi:hypothetical protein
MKLDQMVALFQSRWICSSVELVIWFFTIIMSAQESMNITNCVILTAHYLDPNVARLPLLTYKFNYPVCWSHTPGIELRGAAYFPGHISLMKKNAGHYSAFRWWYVFAHRADKSFRNSSTPECFCWCESIFHPWKLEMKIERRHL